jgi:hypothetical protein
VRFSIDLLMNHRPLYQRNTLMFRAFSVHRARVDCARTTPGQHALKILHEGIFKRRGITTHGQTYQGRQSLHRLHPDGYADNQAPCWFSGRGTAWRHELRTSSRHLTQNTYQLGPAPVRLSRPSFAGSPQRGPGGVPWGFMGSATARRVPARARPLFPPGLQFCQNCSR